MGDLRFQNASSLRDCGLKIMIQINLFLLARVTQQALKLRCQS